MFDRYGGFFIYVCVCNPSRKYGKTKPEAHTENQLIILLKIL